MSVILVVDDEPSVLGLVCTLLEQEGRTVLSASDVAEALGIAAEQESVDVAVLDKNLKEGSGIELVRTLREAHPLLEAIVITAYSSMESAVEALRAEAFDYVTKPWDNAELVAKVAAAEERALAKVKRQERLRHLSTLR